MLFPAFRARAACALSVMSLLAAAPSLAADPPAKKPADAAKKPAPKSLLLSRDELRACMSTKERLHREREETVRIQSELDAEKADIVSEGNALKDRLAALDRTKTDLVEQYVESNNAHDKRIDAYSARSTAFNAKVDALTADGEAYKKNCENRRFDEKDEAAIKSGK